MSESSDSLDDSRLDDSSLDDSLDDRDQRDRRQTWTGFSDALARGIELVATPLLFGLGGWYLDRWAGTRPLFTLLLFLLAIAGISARMYYGYMATMQEHDRAGAWARPQAPGRRDGGRDGDRDRDREQA